MANYRSLFVVLWSRLIHFCQAKINFTVSGLDLCYLANDYFHLQTNSLIRVGVVIDEILLLLGTNDWAIAWLTSEVVRRIKYTDGDVLPRSANAHEQEYVQIWFPSLIRNPLQGMFHSKTRHRSVSRLSASVGKTDQGTLALIQQGNSSQVSGQSFVRIVCSNVWIIGLFLFLSLSNNLQWTKNSKHDEKTMNIAYNWDSNDFLTEEYTMTKRTLNTSDRCCFSRIYICVTTFGFLRITWTTFRFTNRAYRCIPMDLLLTRLTRLKTNKMIHVFRPRRDSYLHWGWLLSKGSTIYSWSDASHCFRHVQSRGCCGLGLTIARRRCASRDRTGIVRMSDLLRLMKEGSNQRMMLIVCRFRVVRREMKTSIRCCQILIRRLLSQ